MSPLKLERKTGKRILSFVKGSKRSRPAVSQLIHLFEPLFSLSRTDETHRDYRTEITRWSQDVRQIQRFNWHSEPDPLFSFILNSFQCGGTLVSFLSSCTVVSATLILLDSPTKTGKQISSNMNWFNTSSDFASPQKPLLQVFSKVKCESVSDQDSCIAAPDVHCSGSLIPEKLTQEFATVLFPFWLFKLVLFHVTAL